MHGVTDLPDDLDGELITRDSAAYDAARRPPLPRFRDVRPIAIARCASVEDVVRTLRFSRDTGIHVVPRSGGHCFAGRSSTEGVILDLRCLDAITVDPDGIATIGTGARLEQVYDRLHAHGRTVPVGCGPSVGIAGLALGGGLGLLGRAHGLTCDALVSAEVVLADTKVVDCDRDHHPDLFWALQGAGGGQFGVVTSLRFATVPEPRATRFELHWPESAAAEVIAGWQDWAPGAPGHITACLRVVAEPGRPLDVVAHGAALRDPGAIEDFASRISVRPKTRMDVMGWRDLKRSFADSAPGDLVTTRSRSEFFSSPLPAPTIAALVDGLPGGARNLSFTPMGGAYNRLPADATAFAHRSERFLLEHVASDGDPWVDRSWRLAHPHGSGRHYPNFPDPELVNPGTAYHAGNLDRLRAVKRAYDADRLFHFPQAI